MGKSKLVVFLVLAGIILGSALLNVDSWRG